MKKTGLWLPNTMWIHTKSTGNIQAKQLARVEETWNFQGYWRTWKFQGSIKKEVEFPQECSRKTHVEWLGGNQKNVWLFGLIYIIHLPISKMFFKFPKICGANFLKCTCHMVNMFLESIMFPLEWWIKWEICDVLYQLAIVA